MLERDLREKRSRMSGMDTLLDPSRKRHTETGADCRLHAAEFFAYAEREPERQAHLISMAESWLRLAVQAERVEAMMDHAGPVIPRNPNLDVE